MTTTISPPPPQARPSPARKRPRARSSLFARGEPMIWISGGALIGCMAMILGLLAIVVMHGSTTFLPKPIVRVETRGGRVFMGETNKEEDYTPTAAQIRELVPGGADIEAVAVIGEPVADDDDDSTLEDDDDSEDDDDDPADGGNDDQESDSGGESGCG